MTVLKMYILFSVQYIKIFSFFAGALLLFGCATESEATVNTEYVESIYVFFTDHKVGLHLVGSSNIGDLDFDRENTDNFSLDVDVPTFRGFGTVRLMDVLVKFTPQTLTINGRELYPEPQGPRTNYVVWQDGTVELGDLLFEVPQY